jgi:hypothetical protein
MMRRAKVELSVDEARMVPLSITVPVFSLPLVVQFQRLCAAPDPCTEYGRERKRATSTRRRSAMAAIYGAADELAMSAAATRTVAPTAASDGIEIAGDASPWTGGDRWFADSSLEGNGFEPSIPEDKPPLRDGLLSPP